MLNPDFLDAGLTLERQAGVFLLIDYREVTLREQGYRIPPADR